MQITKKVERLIIVAIAVILGLCFWLSSKAQYGFNSQLNITFDTQTAERTYQDSTGFYIIHFEYDASFCTIPDTYPSGQPHYQAMITVYQIIDGAKVVIGESFGGQYTEKGCFEDDPTYLVATAKKLGRKERGE